MKESLIGKKVLLKKAKYYDDKFLTENVSEIIFEHGIIGGDGGTATFVGLKNRGELVLDYQNNLRLFLWADEKGNILHDFEEAEIL
jgi:hypothetical protein